MCIHVERPEMKLTHVSYLGDWGWAHELKKADQEENLRRLRELLSLVMVCSHHLYGGVQRLYVYVKTLVGGIG